MSKTRIIIESFHTVDSGGGFYWEPVDSGGWIIQEYVRDVLSTDYQHVTLLTLLIDTDDRDAVTEYLDSILDVIETRQVGQIIATFDLQGIHPRVTSGMLEAE